MANSHTIILMQTAQNRATRTFMDFDSVSLAMDGICGLYERKLKELNPAIQNITYDIEDLYSFIDGLADLSALVLDHSLQAYLPNDRKWIKQQLMRHLKKLAVSDWNGSRAHDWNGGKRNMYRDMAPYD